MFKRKKIKTICFFVICCLFLLCSIFFPYDFFIQLENDMYITQEELSKLVDNKILSSNIYSVNASENENNHSVDIEYKLFDLFTIKKIRVNVTERDRYYAGGNCIGFQLKTKGVILVGGNFILTNSGIETPLKTSNLQIGDIITKINNIEINSVEDISNALQNYSGQGDVPIQVKRDNEYIDLSIKPSYDIQTNSYKLGLWVKDDALGLGTLSFVNATSNRYGALGHAITSAEANSVIDINNGNIYKCKIYGIKLGSNNKAGEIIGTFADNNSIGTVDTNCNYGVYGEIFDNELYKGKDEIEIGGRLSVKPGRAKILSCLDGENIKEYDIEIIKTNYQSSESQKSMVIRVVDKELIDKTGGIVQGMSGSPIIQDGKLVGAVTHVFINDATKGFGLYIDWMLDK